MKKISVLAAVAATIIGIICSILIWVLQPLNDYLLLNRTSAAGDYLPVLGVGFIMLMVLVYNPIMRIISTSLTLSAKQLAIIFGVLLMASSAGAMIPSWPYGLARSNSNIAKDPALSKIHNEMKLPSSLYLDSIEYGDETPVSQGIVGVLEEGEEIPWQKWIEPGKAWGSMLICTIFIMVGLSLILYPQWRDNERLPFPLLAVQQAMVETPEGGGRLPEIFRSPTFWISVFVVFIVYSFNGMAQYTDNAWPSFKLGYGFWGEVGGSMWSKMNWWVIQGGISFIIIGITYFVPNRVSFSIWFTVFAYQIYRVIGYEFFAPFHGGAATYDHRSGAVVGLAIVISWLGRKQWFAVFRSMFAPAKNDIDRRNRLAGFIFLIGCIGLLCWQLWAGNSLIYALLVVLLVVITSLVLARIVAETGIPVMGNMLMGLNILHLFPMGWLSAKSIYLTNSIDLIIGPGASKISAAVTAMHGFGIDREQSPRGHMRLAKLFILIMVAGIVIAGAVHLYIGYSYEYGMNGRNTPIGGVSAWHNASINGIMGSQMDTPIKAFSRGSWGNASHWQLGHFILGAIIAVALQIGCLLSPAWPLHPAGMVVMETPFIEAAWQSILIGWAIKRTVIIYGGAKAYRVARPLFLGLVIGGVLSAIVWAVVPVVLVWFGADAAEIMAT